MRVLKSLLTFTFFLITVSVAAGGLGSYIAFNGKSVTALRWMVGLLGRAVEGQTTEQMHLSVRVVPRRGSLSGKAVLDVRALQDGRRSLYFLLNPGLTVNEVWEETADGTRVPLSFNQLWLVLVVEPERPLGRSDALRVGVSYTGKPRASGFSSAGMVLDGDDVVLTANDFWYPADLQGFAQADVEVTLPLGLDVVHNGELRPGGARGASHTVRWTTQRPVAGMALVAGRYAVSTAERGGIAYRVFLPRDIDLDSERILDELAASDAYLAGRYGPSGFPQVGLFVNRRLARAFHDGGGLIGMPADRFSDGQYGFATVAHEVAHNWWGATVAERWLRPGTGGEWIVEGFSELSSWLALRDKLGEDAFLQRLSERAYDPTRRGTLVSLSAVDNAVDREARELIHNKGGAVALLLLERLGEEAFDAAARSFLERFRYRSASADDLRAAFEESSKQDLDEFFSVWVRGEAVLDLSLDPQDGDAQVRNHGLAPAPSQIDLWRFPPSAEPERQTTSLNDTTPVGNVERLVLDPGGRLPDMYRDNNVLPRHDNPRLLERSPSGDLMVVYGAPHEWMPARIVVLDGRGQPLHRWEFERGLLMDPAWSTDATRILTADAGRRGKTNLLALNTGDGSRQRIGPAAAASGAATGTFVARGDRLLRLAADRERTLVRLPATRITSPLASPDGSMVAYAAMGGGQMDLRVVGVSGEDDRLLLAWGTTGVTWRWAPDGSRLFAVLAGDWDRQLWDIPLAGAAPRRLVGEAATIDAIAVEPAAGHLALISRASVDDRSTSREVYVLEIASGAVRHFNLGGKDAHQVAWLDADSLAVIVSDPTFAVLPSHRELVRLRLSDGSLLPFP